MKTLLITLGFVVVACASKALPPADPTTSVATATACIAGDTAIASSTACLADDAACYPLADGSWCTGPRGRSACTTGDTAIPSSTACLQDDATCYQLSDGSWCTGPRGPHGNW